MKTGPSKSCRPARSAGGRILVFSLLAALAVCAGCQQDSTKHYALRGQVLAKDLDKKQLTVNHDAIPGFMAAMTMPYPVKDLQGLTDVQPGDKITADVVVRGNSDYWLEHLNITDQSGRGSITATAPRELKPGDAVPDVPLINQDDKTIHLADFKGKAVLLTFIYTRCPFPTFCPLISSEFSAIHKDLAKTPGIERKTHLVSISLDPSYDTPSILRKYGLVYLQDDAAGFGHWDFVATSPGDLQKLASAFGLEYFQQDNQISHSMSTVLLARDGTVAKNWPGNDWKTSDVVAALRQAAAVNNN